MSTFGELLAAVKFLRDRTGDPNAWQTGLTPNEVAAVVTPTTRPAQFEAILRKLRQQHSDVFGADVSGTPPAGPPPDAGSDREQGDAAEAIASAEAALAHQNSASSQLDMQVISAILNAHLKAVDGGEALSKLQRETEAAVRTRSDLDTPAGARDFQRFLIDKLRDIRTVVLTASLDDTSKSALMAAWTSLYDASKGGSNPPDQHPPASAIGVGALEDPDARGEPLLDSLLADEPDLLSGDLLGTGPTDNAAAPVMPSAPAPPTIPNFGTGSPPGLGATPGSLTGWGAPGGLPLSGLGSDDSTDPALAELDDDAFLGAHDPDVSTDEPANDTDRGDNDNDDDGPADESASAPVGPSTVTLPDGETVTAASPELAAAIKAAVGGAPIPEAFRQQGITLPTPGTAVTDPVDPPQVIPGDIGMFTDRHALALSRGNVLLDGQIQRIATVSGPDFLGWEHPPASTTSVTGPAKPDVPTPTRPANSSTT